VERVGELSLKGFPERKSERKRGGDLNWMEDSKQHDFEDSYVLTGIE